MYMYIYVDTELVVDRHEAPDEKSIIILIKT